jgi:hypothetical protein
MAHPGETLDMSMVFHGDWSIEDENLEKKQESKCPNCGHVNMVDDPNVDVIWCVTFCFLISICNGIGEFADLPQPKSTMSAYLPKSHRCLRYRRGTPLRTGEA